MGKDPWKIWEFGEILERRVKGGKGKGVCLFAFFFGLSLFETTDLGCTKMDISVAKKSEVGNFLISPTFDCTPGYAPEFES